MTILLMNLAEKRQKLENVIFQAAGIAQKYNCALRRLDYQQEEGFVSSLPLGVNRVGIQRGLTTSSTAIFVPFTTQELFQDGEALYYGVNALSNNLIMCDRKKLKNPNGLILGTPGSGKSFSAKREIANAFLVTKDDIAIIDPEAEYAPLVTALGGQVIKVSPASSQYINPMDINLNYSEEDDPLILKSDFILSLAELMMGRVEADEKSIIDQCLRRVYQRFFADPVPEKMPILQDLYDEIGSYGGDRARHIMDCMGIYVTGSLNVFNHRTNVDIDSRDAGGAGSGVGASDNQQGIAQIHTSLHRRIPPFVEGRADRSLLGGDLEAFPEMGRYPHGHYPEFKGSACQPGD